MPLVTQTGTVKYNDYEFGPYTTTEGCTGRAVYDSAGRTIKYVAWTITLRSKIYKFSPGGTQVATNDEMENIRRRLLIPGAKFYYQGKGFGNLTINVTGTKDVVWGPKPKVLSWKPRGGDLAGEITWQVEVAIPECTNAKYTFPYPAEFNFTVNYAIDNAGFTRRTYKGHVVIPQTRKKVTDKTLDHVADELREEIFVFPPNGFRLVSHNYTVSEDKCRLDFEIVWEDMPAPLPAYVISCNASHYATSGSRAMVKWTNTITAEYELDRTVDRAYAYHLFWELANSRLIKAQFGQPNFVGYKQFVIPLSFSVRENELYGRNKSSFSLSYFYTTHINKFLLSSGLFTAVPNAGAVGWKNSLANSAMHPRGFAKMYFDPNSDAIIDLCATPKGLKPELGTVHNKTFAKDKFSLNTCPPPAYSWLEYDLRVKTSYEDETVELRSLSALPIDPAKYSGNQYEFNVNKGSGPGDVTNTFSSKNATQYPYPNGSMSSVQTSDVQIRTPAAILLTLEGAAMRACWPIQPPNLQNVGNAIAVPVRRGDNFFSTWVACNKMMPINAAVWRQSYFLYGTPGAIGVVPNPVLGALN